MLRFERLFGILLVFLTAWGCAGPGQRPTDRNETREQLDESQQTPANRAQSPHKPSTINWALADDPASFDTMTASGAPSGRMVFNLFEGLLMPTPTTEGAESVRDLVRPGVAKNWEVSEDGLTYTFFPQPRHVVREHGDSWTRAKHMVVNGAYTLQEYRPQQAVILTKNDAYWDADAVSIQTANFQIKDLRVAGGDLDSDNPQGG